MIRYLLHRRMPKTNWLLRFFLPDPERLSDLARRLVREEGDPVQLCREFSEVVSSIRVGDTWKLTGPRRLESSAQTLAKLLGPRRGASLRFLDLGASDGITTLEAVRHLRTDCDAAVEAWLLDLYMELHCFERGLLREYRMSDGSPVLLRAGPLGLQLSSLDRTRDPLARLIGRGYLARFSRGRMHETGTLSLVNPLVRDDAAIHLLRGDVRLRCSELTDRFHVVRASNLLNLDYFTPTEILTALSHLHAYLREDGLLAVSRSHIEADGLEHGSIWLRTKAAFQRVEDFGGGSYIAPLVDEFRASSEAPVR